MNEIRSLQKYGECGTVILSRTLRGLNVHKARIHGAHLITRHCLVCGESFTDRRWQHRKHCSAKCEAVSRTKPKHVFVCPECGKRFRQRVGPSDAFRRTWKRYCSPECGRKNTGWPKGRPRAMETRLRISRTAHGRPKPEGFGEHLAESMREQYACGVRQPSKPRNNRQTVETKKAGKISCRSSWELAFVEILDSSRLVSEFRYEPFAIPYIYRDVRCSYFPDFYIRLRDGREFLVELTASFRASSVQGKAKFRAARNYCSARGVEFKVFTEKINSVTDLVQ